MDQADSVHSTPPTNTSAETPLGTPEKPQDSFYLPADVSPEEVFKAIGRLRRAAREEIDRLLRFLDDTENHMEREPDGDEADVSYPEGGPRRMISGEGFDVAEDDEDSDTGEDSDPAEPALGSLDGQGDQTRWAAGGRRDLELDPAESGIVDLDGLLEQIGSQDWQRGGMV
ncbi:MAG: hypothetical protein Q7T45_22745 [Bradyrhizobium sp.]|uniref:hypothetical protein n=1 Tax=Bradyrhizobium sp. TaxID=376 RepID=UPI002715749D|nr:hypothetical protein [Bradyrhizobium sp.]MDO8400637.1 hypothetical protein [Bradyrhizobium sp.]